MAEVVTEVVAGVAAEVVTGVAAGVAAGVVTWVDGRLIGPGEPAVAAIGPLSENVARGAAQLTRSPTLAG